MKYTKNKWSLSISFLLFMGVVICYSCNGESSTRKDIDVSVTESMDPWWSDATVYEVNVRQYTPEGTFNAFREKLDHLQDLGAEILWFMPIHPIGNKNRKGGMGSYYSVKDYRGISTDYGTPEDFMALVKDVQGRGMKVIIDWVANHTSWDHAWMESNPEFYSTGPDGSHPTVPFFSDGTITDWTDVADLNFDNQELRRAMIEDMKYWVREYGIDGFRCDFAHEVPVDFWKTAIDELKELNADLFMLAECDYPPNVNQAGFHLDYSWEGLHLFHKIAQGEKTVDEMCSYMDSVKYRYNPEGFKLNFITNHDENSWNGTVKERFGRATDAMAAMTFVMEGMPLIYSGQEASMDKALRFFEKDTIDWSNTSRLMLFDKLVELKKNNPALHNGQYGGSQEVLHCDDGVIALKRQKGDQSVIGVFNFSRDNRSINIPLGLKDLSPYLMSDSKIVKTQKDLVVPAYGYGIYE